jgi:hypothetical protein
VGTLDARVTPPLSGLRIPAAAPAPEPASPVPRSLAIAVGTLGLFATTHVAHAEEADAVLYVVGSRVVTRFDVALDEELRAHDRSPVPMRAEAPPMERALAIAVLRERAGAADIYAPRSAEVRTRAERVRASFGADWDRFLGEWGLDQNRLESLLFSRMVVERYVLRNLAVRPDDPEAPAAFDGWMAQQRAEVRVIRVGSVASPDGPTTSGAPSEVR